MVARSVAEVIAGEAVSGPGRYDDMLAIASVIANRSLYHGVTPQQVVARQSEFNAYGKPLPKGANRYVEMAERALRQIQETGPIHRGTFYATPEMAHNLPGGLRRITQTRGHVYFDDPQRRPINTAAGTKRYQANPTAMAYAPQPKPAGALAAINSIAAQPTRATPSRIATPTARPQVQGPNRPLPDASRFGAPAAPTMTQDMRNRLAEQYGTKGSRVPSPAVSASTIARPTSRPTPPQTLTAAQSRNLADRLAPQSSLAMAPRPTSAPRSVSISAPSSVQQAASLPTGLRTAPPSTPRAVSVTAPEGVTRAASLPSGLQTVKGSRVASTPPTTTQALTTKQAVNLASRLGPMQATSQAAALRASRPAVSPASVGSLLGISPAAAATRTPTTTAAPARTNFAGPAGAIRSLDARPTAAPTTNFAGVAGSPRSVDAKVNAQIRSVNPMASQAPVRTVAVGDFRSSVPGPISSPAPHLSMAASSLRSLATPTSRPAVQGPVRPAIQGPMRPATEQRVVSAPARIATPTSRPQIQGPVRPASVTAAPATISSRPAPATRAVATVAAAPRAVATPTAAPRDAWGGLRTGVAPAPSAPASIASRLGITPGRIGGALVGGLVAGPIGAIAGSFLGGRIGGGMNNASSTNGFGGGGMNGMGSNQGSSLNGAGIGGGVRDSMGGFGGFGERDSAVGTNGGKVGGSSKSSSGGKSGGSSGSKGGKK